MARAGIGRATEQTHEPRRITRQKNLQLDQEREESRTESERLLTYEMLDVQKPYRDHGGKLNYKKGEAYSHDRERTMIPGVQLRRVSLARECDGKFASHHG